MAMVGVVVVRTNRVMGRRIQLANEEIKGYPTDHYLLNNEEGGIVIIGFFFLGE
jgi:hypothetical protein